MCKNYDCKAFLLNHYIKSTHISLFMNDHIQIRFKLLIGDEKPKLTTPAGSERICCSA